MKALLKNSILMMILIAVTAVTGCAGKSGGGSGLFSSNKFQLRPFREVTLKNGLKVILIEDQSLPYLSLGMLVRVGSRQDPAGASGLTDMVAELMDKGTRKHTALELSDQLAQYGGEFNAAASKDATYVAASSLSFHQDQLLKHFAEILTEASFSNLEIERLRKRKLAQLRQLADDPESVTELALDTYLYPNHPYSKPVSGMIREVRMLSKKQITKHYLQYYRPGNAQLAVVGKFSPDIVNRLEAVFVNWTDRPVKARDAVAFPKSENQQILLIDRRDLQQTQIRLAHEGIRRNNPDFIALRLANAILGGGFSSRLMSEVRVKRGLTYSVSSYFDARLDEGPFVISTFTRNDKVGDTLREILRVVKEYQQNGPSEVEIAEAKALLKGQFPRTLETPESLASTLLYLRFYGVPDRYLTTYLNEVDKVSAQDLKRVINQYLKADNFKILLHAPRAKAMPQLEGLGPVTVAPPSQYL